MTTPSKKPSAERQLAQRLATTLSEFLAGRMTPADVSARLRKTADWIDSGASIKAEPKGPGYGAEATEVYGYWLRRTNRSPGKVKFTIERRRHVEARLRDGYSVEAIKAAIDHVASNPFHQGDNDRGQRYDDLVTICRNATRLEQYREQAESAGGTTVVDAMKIAIKGAPSEALQRARQDAAAALKRGDTDAYNAANERARALRDAG